MGSRLVGLLAMETNLRVNSLRLRCNCNQSWVFYSTRTDCVVHRIIDLKKTSLCQGLTNFRNPPLTSKRTPMDGTASGKT